MRLTGGIGQLEEYCVEIRLMGAENTQVFSLSTTDPTRGGAENLDSRVYLPHLGFVHRITRNAKITVKGPETIRRPIKAIESC